MPVQPTAKNSRRLSSAKKPSNAKRIRRPSMIKTIYDGIFGPDPLLLQAESQEKYSKAILNHLLLYRPLTTSLPHPLDLLEKGKREAYRRKDDPTPPPCPPQRIVDDYLKKRRTRGTVSEKNFEQLYKVTMVADGENSRRRRNLGDRNHDNALRAFQRWGLKEEFEDRLRIATVGYRVKISRLENKGYFDEELCALPKVIDAHVPGMVEPLIPYEDSQLGRTHPLRKGRVKHWEDAILKHIEQALARKSKVVMLPEFAMPSARNRPHRPFTEDIRRLSSRVADDHFIFAGTRHEERYNRGLILSKKGGELAKDWWHYKTASAKGLGENIMGPWGKNFPSYRSGIRIAAHEAFITVAICYDTYDPTTFLNIVLEAMNTQLKSRPKIILVPSFNSNEDFVALLRDISFLGRCTVVYVNGLHGDAKMFVCGVALSDLANRFDVVMATINQHIKELEDVLAERRPPGPGEELKPEEEGEEDDMTPGWGVRLTKTRRSPAKRKLDFLCALRTKLEHAQRTHALDHIITIEECPKCRKKKHAHDDLHCDRDILYYNLDAELLLALGEFRTEYYGRKEELLPEPFRKESLREALRLLGENPPVPPSEGHAAA
jgi:predicted amidohydrolase